MVAIAAASDQHIAVLRRLTRLIGRYTEEAGIGYVVPDDKRVQRNVMIPADGRNDARNGQLVVAEITTPADAHRPPIGKVLAVAGKPASLVLGESGSIEGEVHVPVVIVNGSLVGRDLRPVEPLSRAWTWGSVVSTPGSRPKTRCRHRPPSPWPCAGSYTPLTLPKMCSG